MKYFLAIPCAIGMMICYLIGLVFGKIADLAEWAGGKCADGIEKL